MKKEKHVCDNIYIRTECVAVLEKDSELLELEALVKKQKENTKNYKENKMKYIPKADIEMMREDHFEATGKKPKKKW